MSLLASSLSVGHLIPLIVAAPLLVATVLAVVGQALPRRANDVIGLATAAGVCAAAAALLRAAAAAPGPLVYWFGGWGPRAWGGAGAVPVAVGVSFTVDPLGAGLALLAGALVVAALLFAWHYFEPAGALFHVLMLVFLAAIVGFSLTGDLFNLFVFFELMSVAAYALAAYKVEDPHAVGGGFNFAVVNTIGAFLMLLGITLVYGRTGALNLAQIGAALAGRPADGLVALSFVLLAAGLLTKAAAVPAHFWLADAHAVAPTPVCVLFSGVMVQLGVYGAARVYWAAYAAALPPGHSAVGPVLLVAGAASAVVGALMCLCQRHVKRLLAFSTISHTGLILIGVGLLTDQGLAGASLYVVGHGLVKAALFLGAGILIHRYQSVDDAALHGRGRDQPWLGVLFGVGGLALAGLPPFGTFLGKGVIEAAADAAHPSRGWVAPLFVVTSALTGGAVLRAAAHVFLGWGRPAEPDARTPAEDDPETDQEHYRTPWTMAAAAVGLLVLAAASGLAPHLAERAGRAAHRFADRPAYAAAVLGSAPAATDAPRPEPLARGSALASGFGSAAGAVLVALACVFAYRVPPRLAAFARALAAPFLVPLRAAHSGAVGDYVTWLIVGTAAAGIAFARLHG